MSINVQCSRCGKRYKVDERFAGKKAKCQSCGGAIAVPAMAPKPPEADDPFAAMDELEQTGKPAEEPAHPSAPLAAAAPPPRRASGTVFNPALARPTVASTTSAGVSQPVKLVLTVGVGIVCFVLAFWAVQLLTGGGSHKTSSASNSSNAGSPVDRGIEASGAADIANGMSGTNARRAPAPSAAAQVPPTDVDVKAKPPAVFQPFGPPDPKQVELLGNEDWLPTAPFVMKFPKNYVVTLRSVAHADDLELKADILDLQKQGVARGIAPPQIAIIVQRRTNKQFPPVFTRATSSTKWGIGPSDPQDKQFVFDGEKVEFGSIDGLEAVRAAGKDLQGQDSLTYCMLDNTWLIRMDMSNVALDSADFKLLDAMVRTLRHKAPKQP